MRVVVCSAARRAACHAGEWNDPSICNPSDGGRSQRSPKQTLGAMRRRKWASQASRQPSSWHHRAMHSAGSHHPIVGPSVCAVCISGTTGAASTLLLFVRLVLPHGDACVLVCCGHTPPRRSGSEVRRCRERRGLDDPATMGSILRSMPPPAATHTDRPSKGSW